MEAARRRRLMVTWKHSIVMANSASDIHFGRVECKITFHAFDVLEYGPCDDFVAS